MPTAALSPSDLSAPKILDSTDDTSKFTCGNKEIDDFIQKEALTFQEHSLGVTYLFKHGDDLIGFATLCMGNLKKQRMPVKDQLPKRIGSYPALLIRELAVCNGLQRSKIGTFICDFCLDRAIRYSKKMGCRFLVVDAVEIAVRFYERYGFVLAPNQEGRTLKMMFLDIMKGKPP
jgi:GNAT superfamily N-acetyltransferase